jgi:hypothetical protein
MKKISLLFFAFMMTCISFAQTKTAVWPEMGTFHELMSSTFHPAEEGNFAPLKEKAADLYRASKLWYSVDVPAEYNFKITKKTLEQLMIKCNDIWAEVASKTSSDVKLKTMITEAHDIFHKLSGECKKK